MSDSPDSLAYGRFDELAEEFAERCRRGERPSIEEFVHRLPEMAGEIREMFPALVQVEQAEADARDSALKQQPAVPLLNEIGDYRIVREVGRGGMGLVYEAFQVSLGRRVALKILPGHVARDSKALARFRREAKAAARLHHTNIVPVFEVGQEGEVAFYAMQFIQGQGLDQVIDELARLRGPHRNPARENHDKARPGRPLQSTRDLPSVPLAASRGGSLEQVAESLLSGRLRTERLESSGGAGFAVTEAAATDPWTRSVTGDVEQLAAAEKVSPMTPGSDVSSSAVLPGGTSVSSVESSSPRQPYFRSVAQIGRQAAQGLAYAHSRGIIHRDIKPSNLLLDTAGVVWITDFGLAKADEDGLTLSGDVLGTLRYIPPERFRGQGDARADIYSLGLTLYELLTLRPAFAVSDRLTLIERIKSQDAPPPRSLDNRIPRDLETIVQKAIDKDPSRRYATADAMAEDLRRFLADEPIHARQTSVPERYWRWARRNPSIAALGGSLTAVLVAATIVSLVVAGRMARLVEKERIAGQAERASRLDADQAREAAERSQTAAQAETYRATLSEVKALRAGHPLGWRDFALHNLARLASSPTERRDLIELRNEAVQCLGELDIVEVARFEGSPRRLWSLEFSPHSQMLATAAIDGVVDCWSATRRCHLWHFASPPDKLLAPNWMSRTGPFMDVRFLPDGTLVHTTWHHRVEFKTPLGRPSSRPAISGGTAQAIGLAIDRIGHQLAVGWNDGRIDFHDAATGSLLRSARSNPDLLDFDLSPDGRWLACCNAENLVQIRPAIESGPPITLGRHRAGITSVAFSPDGMSVATTSWDHTARLWDVARREERVAFHGHKESVSNLAFSPDGRLIATASQDYTVRVWDARTGQTLAVLPGRGFRKAVAFSPDGRYLAADDLPIVGGTERVRLYELAGRRERQLLVGHKNGTQCLAFHPRRPILASGADDHAVIIWDAESARPLRQWASHERFVGAMAFSPDGSLLASGQGDIYFAGAIRVWDPETGALRQVLLGHKTGIHAAAFDSSGRRLATGDTNGVINIYDLKTGQIMRRLMVGPSWVWSIGFVDDDRRLVTESSYGPIVVYDLERSEPPRRIAVPGGIRRFIIDRARNDLIVAGESGMLTRVSLRDYTIGHHIDKGHDGMIESVALSPDGRLLATGGANDRRVILRDAVTFEPVLTFPLWTGMVKDLAFDCTGRWLAIAGADSDVGLWDLQLVRDQLARLGLAWDQAPPTHDSISEAATTDEHPAKEVPVIRPTSTEPPWAGQSRNPPQP